jgi:hypothetical protein
MRVQPVLPKHNSVGELQRYPSSLAAVDTASTAKYAWSLFMATSTLFCLDIPAGDLVSNFRRPTLAIAGQKRNKNQGQGGAGGETVLELLVDLAGGSGGVLGDCVSRIGGFLGRLPDKKDMRQRAICGLAELDIADGASGGEAGEDAAGGGSGGNDLRHSGKKEPLGDGCAPARSGLLRRSISNADEL